MKTQKEDINKLAEEYSFYIPSELFHKLPDDLKELWAKECEQHFKDGYKCGIKNK